MKCRKRIRRCQNRGLTLPPGSARGNPEARPSGIRHVGGAKLNQALVWNVRTCSAMSGSFQEGEGQPGSGWSRRTVDCGLRGGAFEQPLQALESAVVRELLSSPGPA